MKFITIGYGALLGLAACSFRLDVQTPLDASLDAVDGGDAGDPGLESEPDGEAGAEPPPKPPKPPKPVRDAAVTQPEVQHAQCLRASGGIYPLPDIFLSDTDPTGRPAFDLWRDLPCEAVESYPLCSPGHQESTAAWACHLCLHAEGDAGVCNDNYGTGEPLTYRNGDCRVLAPIAAKTRACCAQLPGFDCRPWPFQTPSKIGELCVEHVDCEPGLECKYHHTGAGKCSCPEDVTQTAIPADCVGWGAGE